MKYLRSKQATENALRTHEKIAQMQGCSPEYVARKIVENRKKDIGNYIKNNGFNPAENPSALALQALLIHDGKIKDMQSKGIPDYYIAENTLLQKQIEQEESGFDNFIGGSLLGSIFRAGDAALDKVNKKRLEKGLKPILSGKLAEKIRKNVKLSVEENRIVLAANLPDDKGPKKSDSQIGAAIEGINESLTKDGKNDFIHDNLLVIVIAFYGVIYLLSNQK